MLRPEPVQVRREPGGAPMTRSETELLAALRECLVQSPHDAARASTPGSFGLCLCRWCKAHRLVKRLEAGT